MKTSDTTSPAGVLDPLRYWLGGRRGLIVAAALALVAGIVLNWSWLVAAGIAPLILAVLPCVAMCALGVCANRMSGKNCANERNERVMAESGSGASDASPKTSHGQHGAA
jgi:hypothetical protein